MGAGMTTYRIVRGYRDNPRRRTIKTDLTLVEARAHCADPETSSSTATSTDAVNDTIRNGPWFDGYEKEE